MGANSPATQQPHHRLPLCASDPAFSSFPRSCTSCLPCLPQACGRDVCTSIHFASHLSLPHWAPGRKASRKTPLPISGSLPSCLSWPSALPPRPAASGKCLVLTNSSRCPVVACGSELLRRFIFQSLPFVPRGNQCLGFELAYSLIGPSAIHVS